MTTKSAPLVLRLVLRPRLLLLTAQTGSAPVHRALAVEAWTVAVSKLPINLIIIAATNELDDNCDK